MLEAGEPKPRPVVQSFIGKIIESRIVEVRVIDGKVTQTTAEFTTIDPRTCDRIKCLIPSGSKSGLEDFELPLGYVLVMPKGKTEHEGVLIRSELISEPLI